MGKVPPIAKHRSDEHNLNWTAFDIGNNRHTTYANIVEFSIFFVTKYCMPFLKLYRRLKIVSHFEMRHQLNRKEKLIHGSKQAETCQIW